MKLSLRFLVAVFGVLLVPGGVPAADRHVVVISIDGLPHNLLDAPEANMPTLRAMRAAGVMAKEGMVPSNPSVTWPNHTTLMTGVQPERHGVLFNGGLERAVNGGLPVRVNPVKTQAELVHVPMLFERLKGAGMTSGAINWPCTAKSASIEDNFPDAPNALRSLSERFKQELEKKDLIKRWTAGNVVVRDEVWTEAACHVLRERKPNLLVLHVLNLDSTHHRKGPGSSEGYEAMALADTRVSQVLKAIDEAGIRDATTVFVVSDHGFAAVPRTINANVILKKAGLVEVKDGKFVSAKAQVIPEGGTGMLYFQPDASPEDRAKVRELFAKVEGVESVLGPDDFAKLRMPQPGKFPQMADLIIAAKDGYAVSGTLDGTDANSDNGVGKGAHGFVATQPKMRAVFIAAGAGIKAGVELKTVDNSDVAPTIAKILGVPLPGVTGHALTEILRD